MSLLSLVKRLRSEPDVEPSTLQDAGAGLRPAVPLAKTGGSIDRQVAEYARCAGSAGFRKDVAAILGHRAGTYWHVHPVLAPSRILFAQSRSLLATFLAGCVPIAHDPDTNACLVVATESGAVASFVFDDVAPSDVAPSDFVVEAASIAQLLTRYGDPARRPRRGGADVARRYRRAIWLSRLVHAPGDFPNDYDGEDELARIAHTARDAAGTSAYARERSELAKHPHLAAYWLLSHAVLGDVAALADALERTRKQRHPAVVDLRSKLEPITRGKPVLARLFERHCPDWDAGTLASVLARIAAEVAKR